MVLLSASHPLIPIRRVTQRRMGKSISGATLNRWIRHGCYGVKLQAVMVGGTWHTTEEAFDEFVTAQTSVMLAAKSPAPGAKRGGPAPVSRP
jgi:hypothetical protein